MNSKSRISKFLVLASKFVVLCHSIGTGRLPEPADGGKPHLVGQSQFQKLWHGSIPGTMTIRGCGIKK